MKRRRSRPENGAFCTRKGEAGGEPGRRLRLWQLLAPLRLCPPALQRVDPLLQGLHLPVHGSHCGRRQPGRVRRGCGKKRGRGPGKGAAGTDPQVGGSQKGPPHLQLRRTEILRSSSERCRDSSITGDGCAGASGRAEGEAPAGGALQDPSASLRRLPAKKGHLQPRKEELCPFGAERSTLGEDGTRRVLETSTPPGLPTQGKMGGWGSPVAPTLPGRSSSCLWLAWGE